MYGSFDMKQIPVKIVSFSMTKGDAPYLCQRLPEGRLFYGPAQPTRWCPIVS